jgi:DNA-directed RNA polymerase specialized sigma subunit
MYSLSPAPPKYPLNEYIKQYKLTNDENYLNYFLHCYEPTLNKTAWAFCVKYHQEHRFQDVKQTIVEALFEKLPEYDPSQGVTFLQFSKYYVQDALHEYVRINGSIYSIETQNRFKALRKANAIYYLCLDKGMDEHAAISACANQMALSENTVKTLIAEGIAFRYYNSTDSSVIIEEGEEIFEERYFIGDRSIDPATVVPQALFMDEIINIIEKLPYRQCRILYESCGIKCIYCGRIGKRKNYAGLANEFELYSESAVEKQRKAAIRQIIEELHYSDVVRLAPQYLARNLHENKY